MEDFDYDYIIVGSGFGGSVAALRLTQKGYRVLVLEAGRQFASHDFPKTNWNFRKFLFMPRLGGQGIMRVDFFRGLMVLSGAGVGGGSLVYANTLIEPSPGSFLKSSWPRGVGVNDWWLELKEHYATAKRMLGATPAPTDFPADRALAETASALGCQDSLHKVNVGVHFGEPKLTVPDPYFGGEGPSRSGCTLCGGCMVGCRYNAKNTLDKNYLYLARKRGAQVLGRSEVTAITPLGERGYAVSVSRPGMIYTKRREFRAKNVIVAAGVLGTLKLLLKCRDELNTMPQLSQRLGQDVRTNSESIIGVRSQSTTEDFSRGVAIATGFNPDSHTKIEAVRYPKGSDAIAMLSMPLLESETLLGRMKELALYIFRNPVRFVREWIPKGFAQQSIILLVMQTLDSKMGFRWRRSPFLFFKKVLRADFSERRPPVHIPEANRFAKELANKIDGTAGGSISDVLGMSVTAHVLGGCPMGSDVTDGVIDHEHRVHNYPGLYVVGGAAVPANLGVNPSLTITAMAERAMERIPASDEVREDTEVAA